VSFYALKSCKHCPAKGQSLLHIYVSEVGEMAKKNTLTFIYKGSEANGVWYPAKQYPIDNLPAEIKTAIERGWIRGYFEKCEPQSN